MIPARGGSKGLPRKNLLPIAGVPLVVRAVRSALGSRLLTDLVVSTDSDEIATEAINAGALVIMRPSELATDEAGMLGVLQHAVRARGGKFDLVVCLQPTSPFRTSALIDTTIQKVLDTGADSAQTVTEALYSPFFMSTLEGDRVRALFADGHQYARRQDAPTVYMPTGAVYVTRTSVLLGGRILGEDNRAVVCGFEESVNIDTVWDYRMGVWLCAGR